MHVSLDVALEATGVHAALLRDGGLELRKEMLHVGAVRLEVHGLGRPGPAAAHIKAQHELGRGVLRHGAAAHFHVHAPVQVPVLGQRHAERVGSRDDIRVVRRVRLRRGRGKGGRGHAALPVAYS